MFIGFVQFPPLKPDKEEEFLQWFFWSNSHFSNQQGFISRKLIRNCNEPSAYAAMIEFDCLENFKKVAQQSFHDESAQRLACLIEGKPIPLLYETISQ